MTIRIVSVAVMEITTFIAVFQQGNLESRLDKDRAELFIIINNFVRSGRMILRSGAADLYEPLIIGIAEITIRYRRADPTAGLQITIERLGYEHAFGQCQMFK